MMHNLVVLASLLCNVYFILSLLSWRNKHADNVAIENKNREEIETLKLSMNRVLGEINILKVQNVEYQNHKNILKFESKHVAMDSTPNVGQIFGNTSKESFRLKRFLVSPEGTTQRPPTTTPSGGGPPVVGGKPSFSATLSQAVDDLPVGEHVVIFNHVISNNGGAYNLNTGVFTAPNNGSYFFFSNLMSEDDNLNDIELIHNNRSVCTWNNDRDAGGSLATVLELKAGDRVAVMYVYLQRDYSNYWFSASFSGFQV